MHLYYQFKYYYSHPSQACILKLCLITQCDHGYLCKGLWYAAYGMYIIHLPIQTHGTYIQWSPLFRIPLEQLLSALIKERRCPHFKSGFVRFSMQLGPCILYYSVMIKGYVLIYYRGVLLHTYVYSPPCSEILKRK